MSTGNGIDILLTVNFVCDKQSIHSSFLQILATSKQKEIYSNQGICCETILGEGVFLFSQLIHALVTPKGAI